MTPFPSSCGEFRRRTGQARFQTSDPRNATPNLPIPHLIHTETSIRFLTLPCYLSINLFYYQRATPPAHRWVEGVPLCRTARGCYHGLPLQHSRSSSAPAIPPSGQCCALGPQRTKQPRDATPLSSIPNPLGNAWKMPKMPTLRESSEENCHL